MENTVPVLEVRGITKRFPGVLANDHIDLALYKGQVLGLLGENGAGKSTLMNLIYGLYKPDEGEILVNGEVVEIAGPSDAIARGIGMVHQHFQLVDVLTVTENVMLGNESTTGPFLRGNVAKNRILEISKEYGLEVDPDALVADIPVGTQQRVEIIKALYRDADILILDEPTAVLTPQETRGLFKIMRTLIDRGVSIIFISHKLKEVLEICDDVVVLRRGKSVGHADPKTSTEQSLASMMVGRDVLLEVEKTPAKPGDPVLRFEDVYVRDDRELLAVEGVTLEVFAGEILGIAGVQGNGQTELVEAITGLRPMESGRIYVTGQDATGASPRVITELGTAHIPEDRQKRGMVQPFPVMNNLVLCTYGKEPFSKPIPGFIGEGFSKLMASSVITQLISLPLRIVYSSLFWLTNSIPLLNYPAIQRNAETLIEQYDIRTPSIFAHVGGLSGGNQQKVIVARELSRPIKVLIATQPTRGLDVGSIEFIHKQLIRMRDEGIGILLVSSELDEILSLSDRVAVMFDGQIIDIFPIEEADRDTVGLRMAGIRNDSTQPEGES